jgi:hypothetical protein
MAEPSSPDESQSDIITVGLECFLDVLFARGVPFLPNSASKVFIALGVALLFSFLCRREE